MGRNEFLATEIMRFEFNEILTRVGEDGQIDEDGHIDKEEWLQHRPDDVDLVEFNQYDKDGSGFITLDEWLQAYKLEQINKKKQNARFKFHEAVKASVNGLQALDQDLHVQGDHHSNDSNDVTPFYDKLRELRIDHLASHITKEQSEEDIAERRQFLQDRKEVAQKVRLAAKWRNELTDMISEASAIAIALSYEQVFEGIDVYATAQWMGDDEDCMKELKASTLIRALCFIGCATFAAAFWKLTEYVGFGEEEADDNDDNDKAEPASPARVPNFGKI